MTYSSLVASVVRAVAFHSSGSYFKFYWITEIGYGILAILAVAPIGWPALRFLSFKHGWFGPLALTVVSASAGLSAWWAAYHPLGHSPLFLLETRAVAFIAEVHFLEVAMPNKRRLLGAAFFSLGFQSIDENYARPIGLQEVLSSCHSA